MSLAKAAIHAFEDRAVPDLVSRAAIDPVLAEVYGKDPAVWRRRWRVFFLATAGLFGHRGGEEWGVSRYRLKPVQETAP
jgi:cyclopropane-fatty-acyl-phospholipid synthase